MDPVVLIRLHVETLNPSEPVKMTSVATKYCSPPSSDDETDESNAYVQPKRESEQNEVREEHGGR